MNETTAVFETSCPYGYVVPSDPTKKSIMWLPGTVTGGLDVYFISRHMIHLSFQLHSYTGLCGLLSAAFLYSCPKLHSTALVGDHGIFSLRRPCIPFHERDPYIFRKTKLLPGSCGHYRPSLLCGTN